VEEPGGKEQETLKASIGKRDLQPPPNGDTEALRPVSSRGGPFGRETKELS